MARRPVRVGLADPGIARFSTWDEVARRLTDARAGALANRVRRLAGKVGAHAEWHDHVLAEMGVLHLLAEAGQRVPQLPGDLADAVATACGWQVRKADVEAAAPYTDDWLVAGRSDVREDLVEVRRVWLRGLRRGDWAMVLSFAAYRQALDSSLTVGTVVTADLHRYPGSAHRALVGTVCDVDTAAGCAGGVDRVATTTVRVCESIGAALAREPWLERVPAIAIAAVTRSAGDWLLTDDDGIVTDRSRVGAERRRRHAARGDVRSSRSDHDGVDPARHHPAHCVSRRSRHRRRPTRRSELRECGMNATLTDVWHELVTTGLLGTDRRDPPELPPSRLADTVADALPTTPQGRLLATVAATVVARRCGATPLPARPLLIPPDPDDRPLLPAAVVDRWRQVVSELAGARGGVARRRGVERMASGAGRVGCLAAQAPS